MMKTQPIISPVTSPIFGGLDSRRPAHTAGGASLILDFSRNFYYMRGASLILDFSRNFYYMRPASEQGA